MSTATDIYTRKITLEQIPAGVQFDTPRRNRGQQIEISYGSHDSQHGPGDPYMCESCNGRSSYWATADAPLVDVESAKQRDAYLAGWCKPDGTPAYPAAAARAASRR